MYKVVSWKSGDKTWKFKTEKEADEFIKKSVEDDIKEFGEGSISDYYVTEVEITEAQKRAVAKYQQKNYEFIKVRLNKGETEVIKQQAEAEGKSMNQFIRDRILTTY